MSHTKTDQFAPIDYRAQLHASQERERGLVAELDRQAKEKRAWNVEANTLRADLAKAQARCAELEGRYRAIAAAAKHLAMATPDKVLRSELEKAARLANAALNGDGSKSLAAVRLAQRALKAADVAVYPATDRGNAALRDHNAAVKALAQAFGEGE